MANPAAEMEERLRRIAAEMEERLRRFAARSVPEVAPAPPVVAAPMGMELARPRADPIQEKIDRYLSKVPKLKIESRFAEIPDVREDVVAIRTSFKDGDFLNQKAVMLRRLSDEDTAILGRTVLPMLRSGFSQMGVGSLFVLAYQLKDPYKGTYLFDGADRVAHPEDIPHGDLPETIRGTQVTPIDKTKADHEASVYAYIAASTLRMFTKSEENYIKAFNHITVGYERFYGKPIAVMLPSPSIEALKTLSHLFKRGAIFKSTLYRILYLGSEIRKPAGIQRFLYEIHLENTGIHIVTIFTRLCSVLGCAPGLLLSVINSAEYEKQVSALLQMIKLMTNEAEDYKRRMWRFGRLFDDAFMCHLQTKSCPALTYILAAALKGEASNSNQDILNIKQLEDVSPENGRIYEEVGKMIVKKIRDQLILTHHP